MPARSQGPLPLWLYGDRRRAGHRRPFRRTLAVEALSQRRAGALYSLRPRRRILMGRVLSPSERLPDGAHLASDHRRERAKDSFLAAMSHELRTPLNAIIGFAELIDAEVFGPLSVPQYHTYVRDIAGSARHLLQIIEDVLEISRAEAGELVLNKREVDVATLLGQSLLTVHTQCQSKAIRILADAPQDVVIQVDPEKLTRALA